MKLKYRGSVFAAALSASIWAGLSASAQVANSIVVASCGTPPQTYPAGSAQPNTQDTTGKQCTSGSGGGGGGAVTMASGAVASGAYSSGSIASGAFASGALSSGSVASGAFASGSLAVGAGTDGWNVTEGTKADTAWSGSGSGSIVAILKANYNALIASLPAGSNTIGAVTQSGTWNFGLNGVGYSTASSAAEACHVFKAAAATVYSFSGYIGAAGWLMAFDRTTAPSDGAVTPVAWAYAPAAGSWSISYGASPASYTTGAVVCASSTGPLTKTAQSTNTVFAGQVQ